MRWCLFTVGGGGEDLVLYAIAEFEHSVSFFQNVSNKICQTWRDGDLFGALLLHAVTPLQPVLVAFAHFEGNSRTRKEARAKGMKVVFSC